MLLIKRSLPRTEVAAVCGLPLFPKGGSTLPAIGEIGEEAEGGCFLRSSVVRLAVALARESSREGSSDSLLRDRLWHELLPLEHDPGTRCSSSTFFVIKSLNSFNPDGLLMSPKSFSFSFFSEITDNSDEQDPVLSRISSSSLDVRISSVDMNCSIDVGPLLGFFGGGIFVNWQVNTSIVSQSAQLQLQQKKEEFQIQCRYEICYHNVFYLHEHFIFNQIL